MNRQWLTIELDGQQEITHLTEFILDVKNSDLSTLIVKFKISKLK